VFSQYCVKVLMSVLFFYMFFYIYLFILNVFYMYLYYICHFTYGAFKCIHNVELKY